MGRKSGRRPGRPEAARGPSLFFIIALTIGIVLLLWGAWTVIHQPVTRSKDLGRVGAVCAVDAA
jgi:hypothetical protein